MTGPNFTSLWEAYCKQRETGDIDSDLLHLLVRAAQAHTTSLADAVCHGSRVELLRLDPAQFEGHRPPPEPPGENVFQVYRIAGREEVSGPEMRELLAALQANLMEPGVSWHLWCESADRLGLRVWTPRGDLVYESIIDAGCPRFTFPLPEGKSTGHESMNGWFRGVLKDIGTATGL